MPVVYAARDMPKPPPAPDICIKGGEVIDGTGAPTRRADVFVRGGCILWTGPPDETPVLPTGTRVIDARGKVVTPGFIDAHCHGDPFETPEFQNYLAMGVTTAFMGQDGDSPAEQKRLIGWFLDAQRQRPAIHLAYLVGHGTVRTLSGVGARHGLEPEMLKRMAILVAQALDDGCFGLSTGLEYPPGFAADAEELAAVADPVGRCGGLVMSHMRSEDEDSIDAAVDELLEQGRRGRCPVHVSHLKVVFGKGAARAERLLARMDRTRREGRRVTADLYPYTASCTTIGLVFPEWAKDGSDYASVRDARRGELASYLCERVARRNGPGATLFTSGPWTGRTLAEAAQQAGKPFEDLLMDDLGPEGAYAAYFVMDSEVMERLMADPYVMFSSDGSPTMSHPRSYGSFAKVIREFVVDRGLLRLEEAVHKMTGLTAATTGLASLGHGLVREGFAADLLVFDPAAVRDRATFENPLRPAEGFDTVLVNGRVVREAGEWTGHRAGLVLRRMGPRANPCPTGH